MIAQVFQKFFMDLIWTPRANADLCENVHQDLTDHSN